MTEYADNYKIACNIYGGISWLSSGPVGLVWYPSAQLFSESGVVLSGYGPERNSEFGRLPSVEAKIAASREAIENLHPGWRQYLRNPVYVSWGRIPYNQGSWVRGFSNPSSERGYYDVAYKDFIEPDGRIYFAGDHCSHLNAWMEGAVLAAHRAAKMIAERARG